MPWKEELPMDQKLNLSPNTSATPSHLPNSANATTSPARLAINGLIATNWKALQG